MSGQITAIHRGDVSRIQRTKISRVIPIVEMATEALEVAYRCERCFQALDSLGCSRPSEVAGTDRGEKIEADIRGRGAVGDYGPWVFLEIVRRQHVVRHRDKGLEVAPRTARDEPQGSRVGLRDR